MKVALPNGLRTEDLRLVGEGGQGRIYLIDESHCVKIYKETKYLKRELEALKIAANVPVFPRVFDWGKGFMIREFIPGVSLSEYLKANPLTEDLAQQLLEIFYTFKRLNFRRADTRLDHIIITPQRRLRLIDPTNAMSKSESFPKRMLAGLKTLGYQEDFLKYVSRIDPSLARRWSG